MALESGAHIELKLTEARDRSIEYAMSLSTANSGWQGLARIEMPEGVVEFSAMDPLPPAWLIDIVRALLRTVYRNHRSNGAWPRRLSRWRAKPDSRGST